MVGPHRSGGNTRLIMSSNLLQVASLTLETRQNGVLLVVGVLPCQEGMPKSSSQPLDVSIYNLQGEVVFVSSGAGAIGS